VVLGAGSPLHQVLDSLVVLAAAALHHRQAAQQEGVVVLGPVAPGEASDRCAVPGVWQGATLLLLVGRRSHLYCHERVGSQAGSAAGVAAMPEVYLS
jgi:hypothetical protein